MAITSSDIKFKLSNPSLGTGHGGAQADPNASLGGKISTSEITSGALNNVFDNVSGDENAASDVEYRCIFVHNAHASLTLQSAVVWISDEVSGGAVCAIGLDPFAASVIGSPATQATISANESAAPAGVSFTSPTTKGAGLSIGDLESGKCKAIWIRRTAQNNGPKNSDGVTIRVEGDTAE